MRVKAELSVRCRWAALDVAMLLLILLCSLALPPPVASAWVEFNRSFVRSYRGEDTPFFVSDASDVLPSPSVLQVYADASARRGSAIQCDQITGGPGKGKDKRGIATVLFAVSKCLPDPTFQALQTWVTSLHAAVQDRSFWLPQEQREVKLSFMFALIPGTCVDPAFNSNAYYGTPRKRFRTWKKLGDIASALPSSPSPAASPPLAAIIALMGARDHAAYGAIQGFELEHALLMVMNLQICEEERNTASQACRDTMAHNRNALLVPSSRALEQIPIFHNTNRFSCASRLPGGVPAAYRTGNRVDPVSCVCTCPINQALRIHVKTGLPRCVPHLGMPTRLMEADRKRKKSTRAKISWAARKGTISKKDKQREKEARQANLGRKDGDSDSDSDSDSSDVDVSEINESNTCVWTRYGAMVLTTVHTQLSPACPLDVLSDLPRPLPVTQYDPSEALTSDSSAQVVRVRLTSMATPIYKYMDVLNTVRGNAKAVQYIASRSRPTELTAATMQTLRLLRVDEDGSQNREITRSLADYQANGAGNGVGAITRYGRYALQIISPYETSNVYESDRYITPTSSANTKKECHGCVAVVNNVRPHATTTCPRSFCEMDPSWQGKICRHGNDGGSDGAMALLTDENLVRARSMVDAFYRYQTQATTNDGQSSRCQSRTDSYEPLAVATALHDRCDEENLRVKNFFDSQFRSVETTATSPLQGGQGAGRTCFADNNVRDDFMSAVSSHGSLFATGTVLQRETPVAGSNGNSYAAQCVRCCQLETALRARWVDYRCDSDFATERCDGISSQRCSVSQCLVLSGDSLAVARAAIAADVSTISEEVLQKHVNAARRSAYQTITQIHRGVPGHCFSTTYETQQSEPAAPAESEESCSFSSSIEDLLEVEAMLSLSGWESQPIDKVVFWRYRVRDAPSTPQQEASQWRIFRTGSAEYSSPVTHAFTQRETTVELEAWTHCGRVRRFLFYVHLHPAHHEGEDSAIEDKLCERFDMMWYQASVSRLAVSQTLCAHPQSNFVELTFDATDPVVQRVTSKVICHASLNERTPAPMLAIDMGNVRRFAVELVDEPTTSHETSLTVQCTFTLRNTVEKTNQCETHFVLLDCDGPQVAKNVEPVRAGGFVPVTSNRLIPGGSECVMAECLTENANAPRHSRPAPPFKVCGGHVVWANATATKVDVMSTLDDGGYGCCDACGAVACVSLLGVGGSDQDVHWCSPQVQSYSLLMLGVDGWNVVTHGSWGGTQLVGYAAVVMLLMAIAVRSLRTRLQERGWRGETPHEPPHATRQERDTEAGYYALVLDPNLGAPHRQRWEQIRL